MTQGKNMKSGRESVDVTGGSQVRETGHWKRWGGLATGVGSRLAVVPQSLAEMPGEVVRTLLARSANIKPVALYNLFPAGVRTSAEDVRTFLRQRDLSHIKSRANHPELANDIGNVLFEKRWWNRTRGSRNMRSWEVARARLDNFAEAMAKGARATTVAAARGAIVGALMELPITATENILLVRAGSKTRKGAWADMARDIGKSAAAGAAGTVVVTGVAMIGVPMAPAVAVPIAVAGGTLYTWSAAERIWKARASVHEPDSPLKVEMGEVNARCPEHPADNLAPL